MTHKARSLGGIYLAISIVILLCLGICGVFYKIKNLSFLPPDVAEWRQLPNEHAKLEASYILSMDILCSACSGVPAQMHSLLKDAGARPVVRHMLRSPQAIAFALLYESILRHSPQKALPFLEWAVARPFEARLKPGFGHEWLQHNLTQEEQQTVAKLINSPEIQTALTADTAWFMKMGVFETPMLFVNGIPFKPTANSSISYGLQAKHAAKEMRVSK